MRYRQGRLHRCQCGRNIAGAGDGSCQGLIRSACGRRHERALVREDSLGARHNRECIRRHVAGLNSRNRLFRRQDPHWGTASDASIERISSPPCKLNDPAGFPKPSKQFPCYCNSSCCFPLVVEHTSGALRKTS